MSLPCLHSLKQQVEPMTGGQSIMVELMKQKKLSKSLWNCSSNRGGGVASITQWMEAALEVDREALLHSDTSNLEFVMLFTRLERNWALLMECVLNKLLGDRGDHTRPCRPPGAQPVPDGSDHCP